MSTLIGRLLPLGAATEAFPVTVGWCVAWCVIFAIFYAVVFPDVDPKKRAKVSKGEAASGRVAASITATGLTHAVFATGNVIRFLLSEDAAILRHDLYGHSEIAQQAFSLTIGYMVWHTCIETFAVKQINPAMVAHGTLCALVYILGLYPFLHHIGVLMLSFEFSTIFLDLRWLILDLGIKEGSFAKDGPVYQTLDMLFALSFLVVRIGFGLPISLLWWRDMLQLLSSGAGSERRCYEPV